MHNILLAGSSGNIGVFLSKKLDKNYHFTFLGNKNNNENRTVFIDLTEKDKIRKFIRRSKKFDSLIFLVGLAHKKGKKKELVDFRKINTKTLTNLLFIMEDEKKEPKQIIYASSISVYGEKINLDIYDENIKGSPTTPYGITKLESEKFLLKKYSKKSWILRFAPVYSPDFLLNIERRIKIGGYRFRVSKGNAKLSLCSIENIKITIENILMGNIPPDIYNVSDACNYTYNQLLKKYNNINVINIPRFLLKCSYLLGKCIDNSFLMENSIKLISDNIYPSDKIRKFIKFPYFLDSTNND